MPVNQHPKNLDWGIDEKRWISSSISNMEVGTVMLAILKDLQQKLKLSLTLMISLHKLLQSFSS